MLLSKYNRNNRPEFLLTSDWESVNIAVDLEQVKVQLWVVLLQWTSYTGSVNFVWQSGHWKSGFH